MRILPLFPVLLMTALPIPAQNHDWGAVQNLRPGTRITVRHAFHVGCELVRVTDQELTCDRQVADQDRRVTFRRNRIREVRLERTEQNHWVRGATAGAAAGGLLGWIALVRSSDPETLLVVPYLIVGGAFAGGMIGANHHPRGALIYSRP